MSPSPDGTTVPRTTRPLWRLVLLAMLVPVVPFVLLGSSFEESLLAGLRQEWPSSMIFGLVVVMLGADILLPVPSSAINTFAGTKLGLPLGTAAAWIGLTLGACLGFAAARGLAARLHRSHPGGGDDDRDRSIPRMGVELALLASRPVPIVAETCVITLGLAGVSWRRFLPPVLLGNLIISLGYAAVGYWFADSEYLTTVILLTMLVPLGVGWTIHRASREILTGGRQTGES